jgi:hypothetical protein
MMMGSPLSGFVRCYSNNLEAQMHWMKVYLGKCLYASSRSSIWHCNPSTLQSAVSSIVFLFLLQPRATRQSRAFTRTAHIRHHAFLIVLASLRSSHFRRKSFSPAHHCCARTNPHIAPQPQASLPRTASPTSRSIRWESSARTSSFEASSLSASSVGRVSNVSRCLTS